MYVIYDILKTANFCVVILRRLRFSYPLWQKMYFDGRRHGFDIVVATRILDEIVDRETARDGGRALDSLIFPCDERGSHLDRQNS